MDTLSGRKPEQALLKTLLHSPSAEFLAVYGRRRVGKTYLIREFFKRRGLYFEMVGLKDGSLPDQLQIFKETYQKMFYPEIPIEAPPDWRSAFEMLTKEIDKKDGARKIIFFDELPWLATPRSGFIQQLDHFWNCYWCQKKNLILIVCGSAASWMLEKLIHAKGGLHNRLTQTIRLLPFSLQETEEYLVKRGLKPGHSQILQLYMVMGGIPYYLNRVQKGFSAPQNINQICFTSDGLLFTEFDGLFASLFGEEEIYSKMIFEISRHRYGISREGLLQKLKIRTGGRVYQRLNELEEAGFLASFLPYGRKNETFYRIADEYTWFYLHWIRGLRVGMLPQANQNYWLKKITSPSWNTWSGYAFEAVCFKHVSKIAAAIGISEVPYEVGCGYFISGRKTGAEKKKGAQIDLLFDRADGVVSICEIKFCSTEFVVDKEIAMEWEQKKRVLREYLHTKKDLLLTMVTPHGVKENAWSKEIISSQVTLDDLFSG